MAREHIYNEFHTTGTSQTDYLLRHTGIPMSVDCKGLLKRCFLRLINFKAMTVTLLLSEKIFDTRPILLPYIMQLICTVQLYSKTVTLQFSILLAM